MPAQPPMDASRKAARDGQTSRPSSALSGGGANHLPTFLKLEERLALSDMADGEGMGVSRNLNGLSAPGCVTVRDCGS